MSNKDKITAALNDLAVHPLTGKKFSDVVSREGAGGIFKDSVLGQIFWSKSIGRPRDNPISSAFEIECWVAVPILVGDGAGGPAHEIVLREPHLSIVSDGAEDAQFWRVNFAIFGLHAGTDVHVVPHLVPHKAWAWPPLTPVSVRSFKPPAAGIKKPEGAAYLQFELISSPLIHIGPGGLPHL